MIKEYVDSAWRQFFQEHGLADFTSIWGRDDEWFEEPNYGRSKNGWSGVSCISIGGKSFFVKKQSNFYSYSWNRPFGVTLAQKEFENIKLFNDLEIPCMKVVYFGARKEKGDLQALIITEALTEYRSFYDFVEHLKDNELSFSIKNAALTEVAKLFRTAHLNGVMHNSLYPKHAFISKYYFTDQQPPQEPTCRFIDMESARRSKWGSTRQLRDLETFNRRCSYFSKTRRLYFLLKYLGKEVVDQEVRAFIVRLLKKSKK
jgi:hypothetical protein